MYIDGSSRGSRCKPLFINGFRSKTVAAALLLCTVFPQPTPAFANVQTPGDEALSIYTRPRPGYEPQGFRAGDIEFLPSLATGVSYQDNVYATNINQVHDMIYTVEPSLSIQSDFVRHAVNANFSASRGLYRDITDENYLDWNASLGGRFDITGSTSAPLSLSYARQHYRRGSPEDRGTSEPTKFKILNATAGIVHSGQTIAIKAIAGLKKFTYDKIFNPLTQVDNGDRNYADYSLYTSLGFAEEGYLAPFVYTNIRSIDYETEFDSTGYKRDAMEYERGVGTIVNLSQVTKASFNIGYLTREFDEERFDRVTDMTYGVNLLWQPSTLAAFKLEGERTIGETTLEEATSTIDSTLRLSMDYEMFVNVIITPSVSYRRSEYDGIDKELEILGAGIDTTYRLNSNLSLTGRYDHTSQRDIGGQSDFDDYDDNTVSLSLRMQF